MVRQCSFKRLFPLTLRTCGYRCLCFLLLWAKFDFVSLIPPSFVHSSVVEDDCIVLFFSTLRRLAMKSFSHYMVRWNLNASGNLLGHRAFGALIFASQANSIIHLLDRGFLWKVNQKIFALVKLSFCVEATPGKIFTCDSLQKREKS